MRIRIERKNPIVLSLLLILISLGAMAEPESMSLPDFIDEYAKQESKDIIIDPRLRGNVLLSSELTLGRISAEEFHGVLLTHNWAAYEVEEEMNRPENRPFSASNLHAN